MEFFTLLKASQKSGKPNGVFWFSAKTEARAKLQVQVIIEDAGIETGRGCDYQLPIFTNFPVFDDLPEEEVIDFTWCDRYGLGEDGRTWQKIVVSAPVKAEPEVKEEITTRTNGQISPKVEEAMQWPVAQMSQRSLIISQFISEESTHHATPEQRKKIADLEMDTDNSYVQNMLWAADKATGFKSLSTHDVWKYTQAIKTVFAQDKRHELNAVITFAQAWVETPHIDRGLLVKEWASGKRITSIQRTDTGTNAGGGNETDRNPDYVHTLDTLDVEIALATLPMDFNIYDIPGGAYRRAKEIVQKKESPFKEWSVALRKTAGILDYSRAAIFALIRDAAEDVHHFPALLHRYINKSLAESNHKAPTEETLAAAGHAPEASWENEVKEQVAAEQKAAAEQPEIANLGGGVFSIEGLMNEKQPQTDDRSPVNEETTSDVQMETTVTVESKTDSEVSAGQSADDTGAPAVTLTAKEILAPVGEMLASAMAKFDQAEEIQDAVAETAPEYPAYFEPGRYEGLPNNVYHGANGISSTQVKDARVSLMYFNARHVAKTIAREQSKVLDMGNLVHALALQPDNLEAEFSIEPVIPEGAFTTTATLRAFIDEYNAALPPQLSADDIKRLLEEYNANLTPPLSSEDIKALLDKHNASLPDPVAMGASIEETGQSYMSLPAEFQRIEADQKQTAAAMKACIKEFNATLPTPLKTSGSRDALLEQLATINPNMVEFEARKPAPLKTTGSRDALLEQLTIINPDLVAQEAQKPTPLKVSGTKAEMIQAVKSVKPDAVFADELLDAWRANPDDKILVTRAQLATATAIQSALLAHPTAGKFLTHPSRAVEVSYFGFDDETGLEIRVRPDLEIDMNGVRIGFDLKTISMFNVKQPGLKAKLHREIIDRDYHLSAAMYMNTASLDQFFWIFVNKDEGYHWIAIVEASTELLELGALEYQTTMRAIANAFDTGEWPAPIVDDYADELNDFDMRRLEALREQA